MGSVAIIKRNFLGFTGAVRTMQEHIRCFRRIGYEVDIYAENIDVEMTHQLEATSQKIGFWPLLGNRGRPYFNWRVGRLISSKDYDLVFGHGELIKQDVVFLHNCRHLAWELIYGKKLSEIEFQDTIELKESSKEAAEKLAEEGISVEVRQNPNTIGYDGLGYVTPEQKVVAVARDAEGPYVLPSVETVNDGSYPIARPLFMYTAGEPAGRIEAYLEWVRGEGQAVVPELGFVPLQ